MLVVEIKFEKVKLIMQKLNLHGNKRLEISKIKQHET